MRPSLLDSNYNLQNRWRISSGRVGLGIDSIYAHVYGTYIRGNEVNWESSKLGQKLSQSLTGLEIG
jgi:hypothetical protein